MMPPEKWDSNKLVAFTLLDENEQSNLYVVVYADDISWPARYVCWLGRYEKRGRNKGTWSMELGKRGYWYDVMYAYIERVSHYAMR